MWRGGCTIRSIFLDKIKKAFNKDKDLKSLIMDDYFKTIINQSQESWRKTVSRAIGLGIPVPAMSAALSFYDGYRCENLPANLIQAQRDYFGAHSYERIDKPEGVFFHTDWIG
jgi:6-phosphogluconate dehydrogenase